jgi:hypothetical protein
VGRGGHRRRITRIANPVSQLLLAREIVSNWAALARHFRGSRLSLSLPKWNREDGSRTIAIPTLAELESQRVARSSGYRFAVVSDITQFFPSLYTHTFSWALHTKTATKAAIRARRRVGFGEDLDLHARNCQSKQTIGIPIGPDTSHILAEIVGVAIDKLLRERLRRWPSGYRYIDDFVLFFSTSTQAYSALNELALAIEQFELRPNEHKTRIVPVEQLEVDSWVHELRQFPFSHTKSRQQPELHHFFNLAFRLAAAHAGESVMKFALRRVAVEVIRRESWATFESYLLRTAVAFPDTLQLVSQFFATYRRFGYEIDKSAVKRALETILSEGAGFGRHSETAWALWIAIENSIRISSMVIQPIAGIRSSVCALLALDLLARGLIAGRIRADEWLARCNAASLYTADWLLAFQAERDNLFPLPGYSAADLRFGSLWANAVTFYERNATQRPLFSVNPTPLGPSQDEILDSEDNPNDLVEFEDVDEEYIDKAT